MRYRSAVVAAVAVVLSLAGAASATALPSLSDGDLAMRASLHADISRLPGSATIRVIDASGEHIFGSGMDRPMLPASTMKVITATNALTTMGAGHRFTTSVVEGTRRNEIVIVGGGDPLLDRTALARLAKRTGRSLTETGRPGRAISVRLDDTLYATPSSATGWLSGDSPTYAAPVRPLGLLYDYSWDTAANAASAFVEELQAVGINASYAGRKAAISGAKSIASVSPHSVGDAVRIMLIYSENNVAEQLYRHVAIATGHEPTWQGARAAALANLHRLGVPTRGAILQDGSGLSMDNRLTARTLTTALRLQVDGRHPALSRIVDQRWLPTAGVTGTLATRFWANGSSCATGEVFAKTGSLTGVQTLAGVTRGADGGWKVFAVMVNGAYADARPLIDEMAAEVNGCL